MTPAHLAVTMALMAALLWGGGDFAGGFATRRASPLQVIVLAQGLDALILLAAILLRHTPLPGASVLWWGLGGGICNGLGLICLYTALAMAEMGLAAAISGILTAALPALVSASVEGAPSPRHLLGFAVAGVAMWRISSAPTHAAAAKQRRSLWLAAVAGIGFGLFLIFSRQSSRHALLWPLLISRLAGTAVALALMLLTRLRKNSASTEAREILQWKPLSWQLLALGCVAGVLDVAGNLFYMGSTQLGRMDVCAVLASLYPAGTIVLAMALLRERATPAQALGMGLALAAVVLIAG
jgi:drug/metabolite transporter (DMT)-like permease